jgi:hypothetical protein
MVPQRPKTGQDGRPRQRVSLDRALEPRSRRH